MHSEIFVDIDVFREKRALSDDERPAIKIVKTENKSNHHRASRSKQGDDDDDDDDEDEDLQEYLKRKEARQYVKRMTSAPKSTVISHCI